MSALDFSPIEIIEKVPLILSKKAYITLFTVVIGLPVLFMVSGNILTNSVYVEIINSTLMVGGLYYAYRVIAPEILKAQNAKLQSYQQFANLNKIQFTPDVPSELKKSSVFSLGSKNTTRNYFTFNDDGASFSTFDFRYSVKSRKHPLHYCFTVLAIPLNKAVPNIYVQNIVNTYSLPESFTEDQLLDIKIDAVYGAKHKIYTQKNFEIEALQLLDYKLVTALMEYAPDSDIEFIDSYLLIYLRYNDDYNFDTNFKEKFEKVYTLGKQISAPVHNVLSHFSFTPAEKDERSLKKDSITIRKVIGILVTFILLAAFLSPFFK